MWIQGLLGSYRSDSRAAARSAAHAGRDVDPGRTAGPDLAGDGDSTRPRGWRREMPPAAWRRRARGFTGTVENCESTVYLSLRHREQTGLGGLLRRASFRSAGPCDLPRSQAAGVPDRPELLHEDHSWPWMDWTRSSQPGCRPGGSRSTRSTAASEALPEEDRPGRAGVCGDHPVRLPGRRRLRHGDPGRSSHRRSGVRTQMSRQRVNKDALPRLGDDRHSDPRAVPADPRLGVPPGRLRVLLLCRAQPGRRTAVTFFITIAGRRSAHAKDIKREPGRTFFRASDQTQPTPWNRGLHAPHPLTPSPSSAQPPSITRSPPASPSPPSASTDQAPAP